MKNLFYIILFCAANICFTTSGLATSGATSVKQAEDILRASEQARVNLAITNDATIVELENKIINQEYHLQKIVAGQQQLELLLEQRQKNLAGTLLALQKFGFTSPPLLLLAKPTTDNLHSSILLSSLYKNYQQQFFSINNLMEKLTSNAKAIISNKEKLLQRLAELASEQEKLDFILGKLENEIAVETAKRLARLEQARTILQLDKNSNFANGETIISNKQENKFIADNKFAGNKFAELKNSLAYPVVGDIYYNFGDDNSHNGKHENMAFLAHSGSFVRAIAEGLVIFAGEFRSYNNMVILDLGEGYFMLFANMAKVAVGVGDEVSAGDIIGRMGFEKISDKLLQVELRHDNIAIDISAWLAR